MPWISVTHDTGENIQLQETALLREPLTDMHIPEKANFSVS